MTPKDKAEELVKMFHRFTHTNKTIEEYDDAKQCALMTINEVIETLYEYHYDSESGAYEYWIKVKKEVKKL